MVVSRLGFEVDSSQAGKAAVDLDKLASSAGKAEKAERNLAGASKHAETATAQLARQARDTSTATAQLERSTDMVAAAQGRQVVATRASTAALQMHARAASAAMNNSRQLSFQLIDIGQALATAPTMGIYALQNLGFQVAQIGQLYMGRGGFNQAIKDSAAQIGAFAARLGPAAIAVGAVAAAIGGMTYEINRASDVTVGFGDVALATFQVIRDGIYSYIKPGIDAIAPWFASAWDIVVSTTKETGNNLIRLTLGSFEMIKTGVMTLPDAFIVAGEAAANGFLEAMRRMTQRAAIEFNSFLKSITQATLGTPLEAFGRSLPTIETRGKLPDGSLGPFARERWSVDMGGAAAAARMNASWQSADARITDIMNTDYMGRFFDATSARAVQNALADVEEKAGAAGKALKEAGQAGDAAWRKLAREAERAAERTLDFWKGVGRGFINDLKQGLEEGKGLWRSLGDAAVGALQRIADKALEIASDRLITSLLGNLLGGSFLSPRASGAIGAGFAGLYANGAAFSGGNVIPFATGGVVSSPTTFPMSGGRTGLMGEAGPEAIMPLKRGPDGRLGVSAANGNGSGGGSKVEVDVAVRTFMDDNGNWQAKVEEISTRQAGAVVRENNRGSYQRFLSNMGSARKRNAI